MIYSKAIFGSSARNDSDKYSDKDLLIVAEDYHTLNRLKDKYGKCKWSASYYTYSKLEMISKKGGLFIQHLKNESDIIIDDNDKLANILNNYIPKDSYQDDILSSIHFFQNFKNFNFHHSVMLNGWICDVLYVGLRNLLIYKNAEKKDYEFSYLNLLQKNYGVTNIDLISQLKELRVIKRNYREKISNELPDKFFVDRIFKIFKELGFIEDYADLNEKEFLKKIEETLSDTTINPYVKIRLLEGYYIHSEIENSEMDKVFKNPQMYTFNFNDYEFISKLLHKIKVEKKFKIHNLEFVKHKASH